MNKMLQKVITEKRLSWERSDINIENIMVQLSSKSIDMLHYFIENNCDSYNEKTFGQGDFRKKALGLNILRDEIEGLIPKYISNGPGILLIKNVLPSEYTDFDKWKSGEMTFNGKDTIKWKKHLNKLKMALAVISCHLGYLQLQGEEDEEGEKRVYVKEIKDRGMKYGPGSNAHYSDTNQGGDFHTDGAERPFPIPKYLPILFIRPSERGGQMVIKSIYPTHNRLYKNSPELLKCLYENFIWDRRGSQGEGESKTFEKPIFTYSPKESLIFSYLRVYIESGYSIEKKKMTSEEIAALNALDKEISDENLYLSIKFQPGNLFISNNYMTIHGRPKEGYKDSKLDPHKQRLMIRTWVSEIS